MIEGEILDARRDYRALSGSMLLNYAPARAEKIHNFLIIYLLVSVILPAFYQMMNLI